MARTNGRSGFEVRGSGRGSAEEVAIGAYARRQSRRRILLGVFGGALIVGALTLYGFFYGQLKAPGQVGQGDRYAVRVRCGSCGQTATVQVRFDQTFPMSCPKCKERACQVLWQCRDCAHEFVPEQTGPVVRCPACGSQQVGSAATP